MKPLLTALGIDYTQWRALTISALRIDVRTSGFASGDMRHTHTTRGVLGKLLVYVVLGVFMALFVSWVSEIFTAALVLVSYVLFMVGTAILIDHGSAVTSPTDYAVLGYQPIPPRTWFASRLTNVLVYTLAMATAVGLLPAIVFFAKHGVLVGLASIFATYLCAITVTLAVVVGYVWVMRLVGERRLRTMLSYVQLVLGVFFYGGYFVISELTSRSAIAALSVPKTIWLLLYPGTWFASYVELAAGRATAAELLPAAAAIIALVLLVRGMRGRLSLQYAEQLGEITAAPDTPRAPGRRRAALWFRGGEARAMAILVRAQFRNDMKFRMGVLGVLPLTLVYLLLGLGDARDARVAGHAPDSTLRMITLAVLLFPTMLKVSLARSDSFRASWIFFASPTRRTQLIRSAKNVLVAFFLLPYLAFVGVALAWFSDSISYIALYVLLAGLISHLALQLVTALDPELPFSKPITKGRSSAVFFLVMIIAGAFSGLVPLLLRRLHGDLSAIAISTAVIIGVSLLIDRITRLRVDRQAAHLEFQG